MRALFASTQGAGHFNPLVPFADAFVRSGHDVLVAGPPALATAAEAAGYSFWQCDPPDEADIRPVWDRVATASPEEANELVVGEIFARHDARAILPRLRAAIDAWKPDVVLREPYEYGSAVAAELADVPHARVAVGLAAVEEDALRVAAGIVDELRHEVGLEPDADGDRIRRSPYWTLFPESLEYPERPSPAAVHRFRERAAAPRGPRERAPGGDPLVYVSFGSVTGALPIAGSIYRAALDALEGAPVRVLLTVGRAVDPAALGAAPSNVRVEQWVPQAEALEHADAVVCHGGSGTTLGALAAGRPIVVVPLFADQPFNAERVAAVGAGLRAEPEPLSIREALLRVIGDPSYRRRAEAVAAEMRALPPVDEAPGILGS